MPHHRHSVTAQNDPLNVGEVKRGLFQSSRIAMMLFMPEPIKDPVKKTVALFHRCLCFVILCQSVPPD